MRPASRCSGRWRAAPRLEALGVLPAADQIDWEPRHGGGEVATVRRWTRADWGAEGETMAWCCTEGDRAYVGERPVIDSLAGEIEAVTGSEVFVELRLRLGGS